MRRKVRRDCGRGMNRRELLQASVAGGIAVAAGATVGVRSEATEPAAAVVPAFELEETTIAELQAAMQTGKHTARSLAEAYLARIDSVDRAGPSLTSVIEVNPDALAIAEALDAERKAGRERGPLHGIPVVIKDNIATKDRMMTTAGSLSLVGAAAPRDAYVAEQLRRAGAVILGKTNLSEWANFRSSRSSSGWSGRGGQCKNPYALDRNPCGSSSGTGAAIAANLAAVGVGTETDGSIVCPSHACSLVGIKPTLGLVSRSGIVPIAHSQDTAGPMARTVADAAALLGVLAGVDPQDAATAAGRNKGDDYARYLDPKGLAGARIGVAREKLFGYSPDADGLVDAAIKEMARQGAVIVDPADIPHLGEYDDAEFEVLLYEFKADLNAYLAEWAVGASVGTVADVIAFNEAKRDQEMPYFGQDTMEKAQKKGPLAEKAYLKALEKCQKLSREKGLDVVFQKHRLDAVVAPTGSPPWVTDLVNGDHFLGASSSPAAVSGYPSITVPAGYAFGLPVGITFIGRPWGEGNLIRLAYAFEQATKVRRPPRFLPTADLSHR
ncbi:MAG TPA: amidase [Thermoanaerobaculaceae bacterium]|nr:amidase [Thermoanaerobaculaceae bacterium]